MRVIVIGAGVIGGAIALELRLRGAEVILIEGYAQGGHTSAASAGMVNPFSLTPHDSPALPFY
ncbi:MAG: FAD-binding oxidoreductase, partial [Fimbriimonadales bacterium]|nr:FAD-binding oxidoreductase [Fimbriimonadales bacterium]